MVSPPTKAAKRPTAQLLPIEVLIANYREIRGEGTSLARSAFADVAISFALIGAIIGGEAIADAPGIIILLPLALMFLFLYAVQKLRIANLLTNYAVYLEGEINRHYGQALMIWSSRIVRSSLSVASRGTWGNRMLMAGSLVGFFAYLGACAWAYMANGPYFRSHVWATGTYLLACMGGILFAYHSLRSTIEDVNSMTPREIAHLASTNAL